LIPAEAQRKVARVASSLGNSVRLFDCYGLVRRRLTGSQVVILTYHRVADPKGDPWCMSSVHPDDFDRQMRHLSQNYTLLPLMSLVRMIQAGESFPRRAAVVTFDDGYRDNFTNAFAVLKKYRVPALISLSTGNIDAGELFWWDRTSYILWHSTRDAVDLGEFGTYALRNPKSRRASAEKLNARLKLVAEDRKDRVIRALETETRVEVPDGLGQRIVMSWDDVAEMSQHGIDFGAHTASHPNLTQLTEQQAYDEIRRSKRTIEDRLSQPANVFCYPGGYYDSGIVRIVKDIGFACALTTRPGMVKPGCSLWELRRVPGGLNMDTLRLFLSGVYSDAARLGRVIGI